MWVICEFAKRIFVYEVSALPQIWLIWKNGELLCYWPKTNASSKIQSCAEPKSDWKVFKCRLLMNGATFETYESAIEAEKIAEGFSTLSAFRENINPKRKGSDFDCKTDSNSGKSAIESSIRSSSPEHESSDLYSSDSDVEHVGNDSFEFNKRMRFGGHYMSQNKKSKSLSDIQSVDETTNFHKKKIDKNHAQHNIGNVLDLTMDRTEKLPGEKYDLDSPQLSDYSATFAHGGMLTSTVLGSDHETQIYSQIVKIEAMISSFVRSVEHEMHLLKQMVQGQPTSRSAKGDVMSSETTGLLAKEDYNVPKPIVEILDIQVLNNVHNGKIENVSTIRIPNVSENRHTQLDIGGEDREMDMDDRNIGDTNVLNFGYVDTIGDSTFVKPISNDYTKQPNIEHMNVTNARSAEVNITFTNVPKKDHLNNPDLFVENVPNTDGNVDCNLAAQSIIYLPIAEKGYFKQVEELFLNETIEMDGSDTRLEKYLTNHLLPFGSETESEYMDRTIGLVFKEKFFIDNVSWKTQANRVNVSNSNIMACWRKSFEGKFGPDNNYQTFKRHFRRVKVSKRAAEKAKQKKLQMLQNQFKK